MARELTKAQLITVARAGGHHYIEAAARSTVSRRALKVERLAPSEAAQILTISRVWQSRAQYRADTLLAASDAVRSGDVVGYDRVPAPNPYTGEIQSVVRSVSRPLVSVSKRLTALRAARSAAVAPAVRAAYDACEYRRCRGSWAGGNHAVRISAAHYGHAFGVTAITYREDSVNRKWSGLSSSHKLVVSRDWLRTVERTGLATVGGLLTLSASRIKGRAPRGAKLYAATWVVQSRGTAIETTRGTILTTADGAIHLALAPTDAQIARAISTLHDRATTHERAATAALVGYTEAQLDIVITLADSAAAGNCATGTASWVATHLPGRTSATVREVLQAAAGRAQEALAVRVCRLVITRAAQVAA